jgi:hypothetical protein
MHVFIFVFVIFVLICGGCGGWLMDLLKYIGDWNFFQIFLALLVIAMLIGALRAGVK